MTPQWDAIIIGSGFSGLAMAEQLRREGSLRFLILERDQRVGGTWRDNRYPGCACDVPSHLYSLSFAPKEDWQRRYAGHDEIHNYLETVSLPLRPHLRLGATVSAARYDEQQHCWEVTLQSGEVLTARFVMAGLGPLNRPRLPDIPGLASFSGPCFHSMHWPENFSLAGKRVAVIGTGASAIRSCPPLPLSSAACWCFNAPPRGWSQRGTAPTQAGHSAVFACCRDGAGYTAPGAIPLRKCGAWPFSGRPSCARWKSWRFAP